MLDVRHGVTGVSGERLVGEGVMENLYLDIDRIYIKLEEWNTWKFRIRTLFDCIVGMQVIGVATKYMAEEVINVIWLHKVTALWNWLM